MEYPYLGFKNEDGSDVLTEKSIIVFFTSLNKGVVVHNNNENTGNKDLAFGTYGTFDEDEYEFYPEQNTVILQN